MRPPPKPLQTAGKPICSVLLLVCWALFCLHPDPAEAYFETRYSHENAWLAVEHDHQTSTEQGGFQLGLYAGLTEQEGRPEAAFALLPVTHYRLPLDVIDCNPPVIFGLSRRFVSLDVTIQTLLYADLKLKRLMEEYARLQERAKALLATNSPAPENGQKDSENQDSPASPTFAAPALQQQMRLMEAQKRYESRKILQSRSEHINLKSIQSLLAGSLASLERSAEQSSQSLDSMVKSILASRAAAAESELSSSGQSIDAQHRITLRDQSEETELPWIFRVMLQVLQYTLTHKLEVGTYALIVFLFTGIVLSMRRM